MEKRTDLNARTKKEHLITKSATAEGVLNVGDGTKKKLQMACA